MKLLYTKRSPYARKVRVVALEKKISLEFVEEDLTNKSSRLWEANPLGKIPALILDNGQTLCDSPVICEYLDGFKVHPVLIPKVKAKRFRILHLAAVADGLMDTAVAAYLEKIRHPEHFNEDFIKKQEETILRCQQFYQKNFEHLKELSLASIAVACAIGYISFRMPHLGPQSRFDKLAQWFMQFSQRPSMEETGPA